MAEKIGFQDGIEAFRIRMNAAVSDEDPEVSGAAWPDKLAETLKVLKVGHNEGLDRFEALEARVDAIPFPFRES